MITAKLPPYLALILGILLLQPSPAFPGGAPPQTSTPASSEGAGETLVATVCSCDPEARTMNLLTGCGHALRMVKISVGSEAKLAQKGRAVQLSELKPGAIVRVRFRRSEDVNKAQSVEVETPGGGR